MMAMLRLAGLLFILAVGAILTLRLLLSIVDGCCIRRQYRAPARPEPPPAPGHNPGSTVE